MRFENKILSAEILANNCGKSVRNLEDFDRDYWMNADEAMLMASSIRYQSHLMLDAIS